MRIIYVISIICLVLLLSGASFLASANTEKDVVVKVVSTDNQVNFELERVNEAKKSFVADTNIPQVEVDAQYIAALKEKLSYLGIKVNTDGLTTEQAKAVIQKAFDKYNACQPKMSQEEIDAQNIVALKEKLGYLGINVNTDGLTTEQAKAVIQKAFDEYNASQPKMSQEEIDAQYIAALKEKLSYLGINVDTDGLTTEQAKTVIQKAFDEYNASQPKMSQEEIDAQYIAALKEKLSFLGINVNTDGMTTEQAKEAVQKAIDEYQASQPVLSQDDSNKIMVEELHKLGININIDNMTTEEATEAISKAFTEYKNSFIH